MLPSRQLLGGDLHGPGPVFRAIVQLQHSDGFPYPEIVFWFLDGDSTGQFLPGERSPHPHTSHDHRAADHDHGTADHRAADHGTADHGTADHGTADYRTADYLWPGMPFRSAQPRQRLFRQPSAAVLWWVLHAFGWGSHMGEPYSLHHDNYFEWQPGHDPSKHDPSRHDDSGHDDNYFEWQPGYEYAGHDYSGHDYSGHDYSGDQPSNDGACHNHDDNPIGRERVYRH